MLIKVLKVEREVSTSTFGDVVQLVSLPNKRIGLLNAKGQLLIYDLYKVKIDNINLKSKVFQIHPYSDDQIIILSHQNKAAQMFNLKTQQKYHIADIPSNKLGDNFKDSTIFFQTKVKVFRQSGHICFLEYIEHQTNILAMLKGTYTAVKHPLHNTNIIIDDYDQISKFVIYKQDIEKNKPWIFKTIDIQNNFQQEQLNLDLENIPNSEENSLITAVKQLSKEQIIFFVNNQEPGLWIFNIVSNIYEKVELNIDAGLQQIILLDRKNKWLIISYLGRDQDEKSTIDWIDLNQRKLIVRLKEDISNLTLGWENNYFINQHVGDQAEKKFWLKYLVRKSSLIMQILMKTNIMARFGNTLCRKVIQLVN